MIALSTSEYELLACGLGKDRARVACMHVGSAASSSPSLLRKHSDRLLFWVMDDKELGCTWNMSVGWSELLFPLRFGVLLSD